MNTKLQSCASKAPTNYWERLLSESLTVDEPRDQPILRAIRAASEGSLPLEDLARQLYDSEDFGRRFQHFGSLFEQAKLPELASSFYDLIRREGGRHFTRDLPGLGVLGHLMDGRYAARHDATVEAWAVGEMLKSLPNHIHLANHLYWSWLEGTEASPEKMVAVRRAIMDTLKETLQGKTEPSLCNCLNEHYPYNLFHLFYTTKYKEKAEGMAPLSDDADWAWLRPNLLAASQQCPARILPQIIIAVQHEHGRESVDAVSYEFDQTRLETLFGDDAQEILSLIAAGFPMDPAFEPMTRRRLDLAIEKARRMVRPC